MRTVQKSTLFILAAFVLVIAAVIVITACKSPVGSDLDKNANAETRLLIGMYDTVRPSAARSAEIPNNGKNIQGIEALNLTVRQIVIIDSSDRHITILDEERTMDILGVSRSDPVILSDVSVEPGSYKELRLVLKDENTITVNGETHPIKIPSGGQSGLKLKGPFAIPKGKLFTLMIELNTDRSVHWNQGQGYMLKPVLNIANGADVLGIFRGNLTLSDDLGANETLLELYADNTARLRIDAYPNYTLHVDYDYNSLTKDLNLTNLDLDAPGLGRRALRQVMKKMPSSISFPIKEWSLDNIIAIDTSGVKCNLYRVDEFNFSDGVTFTEFTLNIDYPDSSKNGKDVVTEIHFIDTGMPPITLLSTFTGSRITENVFVKNNLIQGSSTRIHIISYLFDSIDDLNTEPGVFGGGVVLFMMTGSVFSESTNNNWQPEKHIFTLVRDNQQTFDISFKDRLNIQMEHHNFLENNPVLRWEHYPDAKNGYVVFIAAYKNAKNNSDESQSQILYYIYTETNSITVPEDNVRFIEYENSEGESLPPNLTKGDFLTAEIYVLDGSGKLDSTNYKGVLYRESFIVKVF